MEEDTEYLKLPLEDRCVHKSWKARLNGYEECAKVFPRITDEKSPEFSKFAPLMKKFVTDSNAVAQEKALVAALLFVEHAHVAGRTTGDVVAGCVLKCLAAPKKGTQEKATEIILMYCEIEKYEVVVEELIKGFAQKNPKVVAACVRVLATALRAFGHKVVSPKPIMKQLTTLLEHRDAAVREAGKQLVIDLHRWIGAAIKPQMSALKPVQIQELEAEFDKLGKEKVVQTRWLRSQQEAKEKAQAQGDDEEEDDEEEQEEEKEIDPYEFMEPVDIISKLPKNFFELIEAKKWQERKEALDALFPLSESPRIEPGDFHELMKVLKKVISKDTNVMLVTLAAKCTAGLARGLKKKFHPFAIAFTEAILEKFKEKKPMVVAALREAIDQVYQSTSIESIQENVCGFLASKNPSVKAETASFLARSFCYCTPTMLNKKLIKSYAEPLIKTLNEPDPTVRDNSAEALGTMLKVAGEKVMMIFLADVEALKMQKIKEASEKADMKVKISAPKKPKVVKKEPEPVKSAPPSKASSSTAPKKKVVKGGAAAKSAGTSGSAGGKKGVRGKGGGGGGGGVPGALEECRESELGLEESLEKAEEVLPADFMTGLLDSNWKSRLAAMESFNTTVSGMDRDDIPCQALVRTLAQKTGFKDNNFQVLKLKLDALKILAENSDFTRRSGEVCIQDLVEKIGDPKNGSNCGEALTAIAEAAKLQWVGPEVMNRAFEQKSPKVQECALKWLAEAITDFGFVLNPKALLGDIKKALGHTNPGVRTAGITLCGVIYLYMGPILKTFFEDEKPALQQQIDTEFEKQAGKSAPSPTRGDQVRSNNQDEDGEDGDDVDTGGPAVINVQDLVPRVDIREQITENLITEMQDKNWKVRNEALNNVARILQEAKFITKDIGELPKALCSRMSDLNKNLALESLKITASLANALGPNCKSHTRNIVPGMLQGMGDSKPHIRQQAGSTLNMWTEQVGVKEVIDGEIFADALKSGSPFLKAEVFGWMAEKLKDIPPGKNSGINKEELHSCTPHLFTAIEDRNADVRKGAQEAVLPFMIHLGYDGISKHLCKVKPASKNTIQQILEKAKPNLPARPPPPAKAGKPGGGGGRQGSTVEKAEKPQGSAATKAPAAKKGVRAPSANRGGSAAKKDSEDVDTSPLLAENNLKGQRATDESRLRVLRWDFQTPRAEFITQLTDQMTAAGFNRQLVANMFHKDFKFHIKAIESLNEDLIDNVAACVSNLDLVLRWLTIRFFDTNPSVVMKGMDYLQHVFTVLSEDGYHMIDHEAYAFMPFLIMKFGDPKEPIRGPARAISKLICNIYPASKVSPYLLEGLKAKNARQRAECLEGIGGLIEIYGMSVCQPSVGVMMKEVAKQIADRDNNVRNAALNALVQVFFREGEKVYKMVGTLADKDMSLLEERIKRAAKNRPVINKPPPEPEAPVVRGGKIGGARGNRVVPTLAAPAPVINRDRDRGDDTGNNAQIGSAANDLRSRFGIRQNTNVNAPFKIDYGLIEKLLEDDGPADRPQYNLEEIPDMNSILNYNPVLPVSASVNSSYRSLARPGFTGSRAAPALTPMEPEGAAQAINMVISQIATPDANTVIQALSQLDEVLKSEERREQLLPHIDQLLIVATLQYRLVLNTKMANANVNKEECIKIYRSLTHCLITIFDTITLGTRATRDVLRDVIHVLLTVLLDPRLSQLEDGPQIIRAINVLVVRIVEKAQFTHIFSALLKLLHESVGGSASTKFTELVMKCNWKIIRILSSRNNDLDLDQILLDVHNFLEAYPVSSWTDRPSDTPLRTIKTVIHTLCQVYGATILSHFSKIDNSQGSELHKYLTKTLKKPKLSSTGSQDDSNKLAASQTDSKPKLSTGSQDDSNKLAASQTDSNNTDGKSPKRLSKTAHNQLSEIFRKIGSKENTKEGLIQLYEFKQKHPEADIEPFLRKSSQFFQNYIERGLKRVEMERQAETKTLSNTALENGSNSAPLSAIQVQDSNFNMNELVDQFKALAARAGFDNTYIDTAVKDITNNETKTSQVEEVNQYTEYIKSMSSDPITSDPKE